MIRVAVTEDRALQGCNLSAVDGPELAGGVKPLPPLLRYRKRDRMSDLHDRIRSLSEAEFDLLDALLESLESDPLPLSAEQRGELDYRVARYRENPADVIPWETLSSELRNNR